jgi:cytochrome c553
VNPTRSLTLSLILSLLTSISAVAMEPIKIELEFTPNIEQGKRHYHICARCHLPEAWGNEDGTYPQLAGQHINVLMKQLLDIRSGKRNTPLMYPFVQQRTLGGYQEMSDVVAYISTLPMNPSHSKGPWSPGTDRYQAGQKIYQQTCVTCHGERAEGNNELVFPRLQGQQYPYMSRQMLMIKKGLREVAPVMKALVDQLDEQQLENVVNYISYIQPDADKLVSSNKRNESEMPEE